MPRLRTKDATESPFPLPPLAEQHRIVAKVEELMKLLDQLEASRSASEGIREKLTAASHSILTSPYTTTAEFPSHANFTLSTIQHLTTRPEQIKPLRQTIINLAVQGKLLEQVTDDEPASELLKLIAAEKMRLINSGAIKYIPDLPTVEAINIQNAIPKTWEWVRFGNLVDFSAGRTPPRNDPSFWNSGDYQWVSIADMVNGNIVDSTKETISEKARNIVFKSEPVQPGTMIMSFKLTIGKIARLGVPCFHNEAIISIRPHLTELDPYLFIILPSLARRGETKGAIKGATLNRESISNILIPLPPLAEQRRIVEMVDSLMLLCDKLEVALENLNRNRSRLITALITEALSFRTDIDK